MNQQCPSCGFSVTACRWIDSSIRRLAGIPESPPQEQRACTEWLKENLKYLFELFSFGHHGAAFTVASC
jgi:hypothetical protein